MITKEELYNKIQEISILENKCKSKINKMSLFRLISFLVFVILAITCIAQFEIYFLIITFIALILFIILIISHDKLYKQLSFLINKKKVIKEYISRQSDEWHKFLDNGSDIRIDNEELAFDLDIVGDRSLFQYLNVCKSESGRKKFANLLINGQTDINKINDVHNSLNEFIDFKEQNIEFQAYLKDFDKKIYRIKKNVISFPKSDKYSKWLLYIGLFLTLGLIISFILVIFKIINPVFLFIWMFLQLVLSYIGKNKNLLNSIDNAALYYHSLKDCYQHLTAYNFKDNINLKHQENIKKSLDSIKKIAYIQQLASIYRNGITSIIVNLFVPFNDILINKYLDFSKSHPEILENSIDSLNYFEILTSLANLFYSQEFVCTPKVSVDIELTIENIKHPLLNGKDCVGNNFNKKNNINIITGSNMSGKTSFLRTIGINIALMKAGGHVVATSFTSSIFEIFTSMRVKDDIQKGISTFYAELLRIKKALDYSRNNKPLILLVDEIFKGTNMNDRLLGAKSVMKKLDLPYVVLFITTHDFELCDYNEVSLTNYHFSEQYEDNKIRFDYLIKEGKCLTTNAIYLMKNTNIID